MNPKYITLHMVAGTYSGGMTECGKRLRDCSVWSGAELNVDERMCQKCLKAEKTRHAREDRIGEHYHGYPDPK